MKKLIALIILTALLLELTACYNLEYITKDELIKENSKGEIIIYTRNNSLYKFITHSVVNDSLTGKGYLKSHSDPRFSRLFNGKIALDDIASIKQDRINWLETSQLILGTVIIIGGVVIVHDFSDWND